MPCEVHLADRSGTLNMSTISRPRRTGGSGRSGAGGGRARGPAGGGFRSQTLQIYVNVLRFRFHPPFDSTASAKNKQRNRGALLLSQVAIGQRAQRRATPMRIQ